MNKVKKILKNIFQPIKLLIIELKLVEWPSLKVAVQSTALVLVISVFVGIIIVVFDTVLFEGRNFILDL